MEDAQKATSSNPLTTFSQSVISEHKLDAESLVNSNRKQKIKK